MTPSDLIDISVPLGPSTPVWPDSDAVSVRRIRDFARGDDHAVSQVEMSTHAGTHADAPHHFLRAGKTLDRIPLDVFVGPCLVLDVATAPGSGENSRPITADDLAAAGLRKGAREETRDQPPSDEVRRRILIRTRSEGFWDQTLPFDEGFRGLDLSAAELLVSVGAGLIGLDVPSVEPFRSPGQPVHHRLMEEGIVLLETLRLSHVPAGVYELICMPLALKHVEAAPARAILRR